MPVASSSLFNYISESAEVAVAVFMRFLRVLQVDLGLGLGCPALIDGGTVNRYRIAWHGAASEMAALGTQIFLCGDWERDVQDKASILTYKAHLC